MNRSSFYAALIFSGLSLVTSAKATEYFVSPSGRDDNPGTDALPFQTLGHAASVVQPGDICSIHAGTYRETLKPAHSGAEGKPILFRACEGEKVVISGLDLLTGWQQRPGSPIWAAPMAWDMKASNQVFYGDEMLSEARWPHKTNLDPMKPEGAQVQYNSGEDKKSFVCPTLPDFPPDVWQGATVWMLAGSQWSSWTNDLTGYDPAQKRLYYDVDFNSKQAAEWVFIRHVPGGGSLPSKFYIRGNIALLQSPGEWFYDAAAGKLLLIPPQGSEADFASKIEAKKRLIAVDFSKLDYVDLTGVDIFGATLNLSDATHCTVEGVHANYISHSCGGKTINNLREPTGIWISGHDNELRDSEIAWSAGDGVNVLGEHNKVVNCYIHDCDYMGVYAGPVKLDGSENLLSHCTISRAGRDDVRPGGTNLRIEYNDISRAGLICSDLGMIYSAGHDGENTEISYNWVHDAMGHMNNGIYMDNYSRDFIVHHNVVWHVSKAAIVMNRPSDYNMVFCNTIFGPLSCFWGPWKNPITMPGCRVIDNVAVTVSQVKEPGKKVRPFEGNFPVRPEVQKMDNDEDAKLTLDLQGETLQSPPISDQTGIALAGITPPEDGDKPTLGAYQAGGAFWKPGWDPKAHPQAEFRAEQTYLRNLLPNSSFDSDKSDMAPWQNSAGSSAKIESFGGFNFPAAETRNAIQKNSLHLTDGSQEVFQDVTGLPSGKPLVLAGYVRGFNGADVSIVFQDADGTLYQVHFPAKQDWVYNQVEIPAREGRTSGRILVRKDSAGDAYVDNMGLSVKGL